METLFQDLRYALRTLRRAPGFTIAAVGTLALGIGVNTAMFTVVNAAFFQPPPAANPEQLVWLQTRTAQGRGRNLSYREYLEFRDRVSAFSGLMATENISLSLGGDAPEVVPAQIVSGNYFNVIGVRAALGRTFDPADDAPGNAPPVAVISNALWTRRFGGDSAIVGRTLLVNGQRFTVIGVAPRGFEGIEFDGGYQVWVPIATLDLAWPAERGLLAKDRTWLHAIGRLKTGVGITQAQAAATAVARTMTAPLTTEGGSTPEAVLDAEVTSAAQGGVRPSVRRKVVPIAGGLLALPLLVLLIACANTANVLISRGLGRRREIAVRRAIGATRARLVRQLLTEAALVSVAAAALGVTLSSWFMSAMTAFGLLPLDKAATDVFSMDARVLGYAITLAMLTGLGFGLAPALSATNPSLTAGFKADGATIGFGSQRHRLRDLFVIGQVAVSLTLVVAAALVLRSFGKALDVNPGFDVGNGFAVSFDQTMSGYSADRREFFLRALVERVSAIPGVQSASIGGMPLTRERSVGHVTAEDSPEAPNESDRVTWTGTWPGYFRTLGMPLVAGRDFLASDNLSAAPVAIVNEQLAQHLWPGEVAIGKRVRLGDADAPMRTVVGVSRDAKYYQLTESPEWFAYVPERQDPQAIAYGLSLVVRSSAAPAAMIPALDRAVRGIEPNPPFYRVRTFSEVVARNAEDLRGVSRLLTVFGVLAIGLAALGLYGVIAHAVSSRTREIGVRIALGARSTTVVAGFVREGASLALFGVAAGVPLGVATGIVMRGTLFGVGPLDPASIGIAALVLGATAAMASYIPARRAARVDPMVALRAE